MTDDGQPAAGPRRGRADVVGHRDWMAEDEFAGVFCPGDPQGLADAVSHGVRWVWGSDGHRWFDYDDARQWKAAQDPAVAAFHTAQRAADDAWRARRDTHR